MNHPNITLNVEELSQDKTVLPAVQFAKRAAEIISNCTSSIIYTDFIADIGPPSRRESYMKWKTDEVKVIVATKAFGMGIDKPDICHVIRNGVPESMLCWAHKLGRAGRDGHQSSATIIYRKSDLSHANPWVINNLHDQINVGAWLLMIRIMAFN